MGSGTLNLGFGPRILNLVPHILNWWHAWSVRIPGRIPGACVRHEFVPASEFLNTSELPTELPAHMAAMCPTPHLKVLKPQPWTGWALVARMEAEGERDNSLRALGDVNHAPPGNPEASTLNVQGVGGGPESRAGEGRRRHREC